jgi:hypothetical protein
MHRRLLLWGGAVVLAAIACVDTSAPKGGVVSISALLLPSPSVVKGDAMRDSTGAPAPLRVTAYDDRNQPVAGLQSDFFILDRGAHFQPVDILVGDSLSTVRVVGTIGGLQTIPTPVIVTVAPVKVVSSGKIDTMRVRASADTSRNLSAPLSVTLSGAADTAVVGFVVRYRVLYAPASLPNAPPTVYIADQSGRPMSNDTTDATGKAVRRRAAFRISSLGATLDSVVVEASVSYKGAPVTGSPVRLVFPVKLAAQ